MPLCCQAQVASLRTAKALDGPGTGRHSTCLSPACVMSERLSELLQGGNRLIFHAGDVLFVSSKICWNGINLLFKSKGNVIFQEGRRGGGIY